MRLGKALFLPAVSFFGVFAITVITVLIMQRVTPSSPLTLSGQTSSIVLCADDIGYGSKCPNGMILESGPFAADGTCENGQGCHCVRPDGASCVSGRCPQGGAGTCMAGGCECDYACLPCPNTNGVACDTTDCCGPNPEWRYIKKEGELFCGECHRMADDKLAMAVTQCTMDCGMAQNMDSCINNCTEYARAVHFVDKKECNTAIEKNDDSVPGCYRYEGEEYFACSQCISDADCEDTDCPNCETVGCLYNRCKVVMSTGSLLPGIRPPRTCVMDSQPTGIRCCDEICADEECNWDRYTKRGIGESCGEPVCVGCGQTTVQYMCAFMVTSRCVNCSVCMSDENECPQACVDACEEDSNGNRPDGCVLIHGKYVQLQIGCNDNNTCSVITGSPSDSNGPGGPGGPGGPAGPGGPGPGGDQSGDGSNSGDGPGNGDGSNSGDGPGDGDGNTSSSASSNAPTLEEWCDCQNACDEAFYACLSSENQPVSPLPTCNESAQQCRESCGAPPNDPRLQNDPFFCEEDGCTKDRLQCTVDCNSIEGGVDVVQRCVDRCFEDEWRCNYPGIPGDDSFSSAYTSSANSSEESATSRRISSVRSSYSSSRNNSSAIGGACQLICMSQSLCTNLGGICVPNYCNREGGCCCSFDVVLSSSSRKSGSSNNSSNRSSSKSSASSRSSVGSRLSSSSRNSASSRSFSNRSSIGSSASSVARGVCCQNNVCNPNGYCAEPYDSYFMCLVSCGVNSSSSSRYSSNRSQSSNHSFSNSSQSSNRSDSQGSSSSDSQFCLIFPQFCSSSSRVSAASRSSQRSENTYCGNLTLDNGEECDDGNRRSNDGCSANCRLENEYCGDGIVQFARGETCEYNTALPTDFTCIDCRLQRQGGYICGNGVKESGEQCDDGNTVNGDGCNVLCRTETPCDDDVDCPIGMRCDGDYCIPGGSSSSRSSGIGSNGSNSSTFAYLLCGNGRIDGSEQCDDGNKSNGDGCSVVCLRENGFHSSYNFSNGQGSSIQYYDPSCGPNACQRGGNQICSEISQTCINIPGQPCFECISFNQGSSFGGDYGVGSIDQGGIDSGFISSRNTVEFFIECLSSDDCFAGEVCVFNQCLSSQVVAELPSFCGNARVDTGEVCDEGANNTNTPNALCRTDCTPARCGDGIIDTPIEVCDDGNSNSGDGCSPTCVFERQAPNNTLPGTVIELPFSINDDGSSAGGNIEQSGGNSTSAPKTPLPPDNTQSGPAALIVIIGGAAAGYGWLKRRR